MSKMEKYVSFMSDIQPSEEIIERIMDMSSKSRKNIRMSKRMIIATVVIIILACGVISANAATDGAVNDYIRDKISVLINGEKTNAEYFTDEDGTKHIILKGDIPEGEVVIQGNGEESIFEYKITKDENGVEFGSNSDAILSAENFYEPTTSVK